MRAIDVMTSQIVTATPQTTVQDVAKLMINNRISGLPV
jgi:CBS domain-containing protein